MPRPGPRLNSPTPASVSSRFQGQLIRRKVSPYFLFSLLGAFRRATQVGMRHFHLLRNREHCPIVNLDKLWSMLPAGTLEEAKSAGGKAPVIDVTDSVSLVPRPFCMDLCPRLLVGPCVNPTVDPWTYVGRNKRKTKEPWRGTIHEVES